MGESTMIRENIIMITEWTIIKFLNLFISRTNTILWA